MVQMHRTIFFLKTYFHHRCSGNNPHHLFNACPLRPNNQMWQLSVTLAVPLLQSYSKSVLHVTLPSLVNTHTQSNPAVPFFLPLWYCGPGVVWILAVLLLFSWIRGLVWQIWVSLDVLLGSLALIPGHYQHITNTWRGWNGSLNHGNELSFTWLQSFAFIMEMEFCTKINLSIYFP